MTGSYKELLAQRAALEAQIEQARNAEIGEAIANVRTIVAEFGLTVADIFSSGRGGVRANAGVKVAAKYRNPETGQTWTGRGKPPVWIAGKDRAQFEIPQTA